MIKNENGEDLGRIRKEELENQKSQKSWKNQKKIEIITIIKINNINGYMKEVTKMAYKITENVQHAERVQELAQCNVLANVKMEQNMKIHNEECISCGHVCISLPSRGTLSRRIIVNKFYNL